MTILNDFLYYYENGSKIISPWGKEMIPLLLISYCPTYKLPKNHNESSSSFFWVVTTLGLQCFMVYGIGLQGFLYFEVLGFRVLEL